MELLLLPNADAVLQGKSTLVDAADRLLRRFVWSTLGDDVKERYMQQHRGEHQLHTAAGLWAWAVKTCSVFSSHMMQSLTAQVALMQWDQKEDPFEFLSTWQTRVDDLHSYLDTPWTPAYRLATLKHALPSSRNALFAATFQAFDRPGESLTEEVVQNLQTALLAVAHSASTEVGLAKPVDLTVDPLIDADMSAFRAVSRATDCWACSKTGHRWRDCPDEAKKEAFQAERRKQGGTLLARLASFKIQ